MEEVPRPHLVRAPRVPFFMLILKGLEAKGFLAFQGDVGTLPLLGWSEGL